MSTVCQFGCVWPAPEFTSIHAYLHACLSQVAGTATPSPAVYKPSQSALLLLLLSELRGADVVAELTLWQLLEDALQQQAQTSAKGLAWPTERAKKAAFSQQMSAEPPVCCIHGLQVPVQLPQKLCRRLRSAQRKYAEPVQLLQNGLTGSKGQTSQQRWQRWHAHHVSDVCRDVNVLQALEL